MADKAFVSETANAPKPSDEKALEVAPSIAATTMATSCKEFLDYTHLRNGEPMASQQFHLGELHQPNHTQIVRQERIKQHQQQHQSPNLPREKHKQSGRVLSSEKSKTLCVQQSEDYDLDSTCADPVPVVTSRPQTKKQPLENSLLLELGRKYNFCLNASWAPKVIKREYELKELLGQGAYGQVFRAIHKTSQNQYAIKQFMMSRETAPNGFPKSALQEIMRLKQLRHKNIVQLHDIVVNKAKDRNRFRGGIHLVLEFVPFDLASIMKYMPHHMTDLRIKCYLQQLLRAILFTHEQGVLNRDVKPANVLIGCDNQVKLTDWGMARAYPPSNGQPMSDQVVTIWYRAPELLLGCRKYDTGVDMWSVGCVFGEMLMRGAVVFPAVGNSRTKPHVKTHPTVQDQLKLVWRQLGGFSQDKWPGVERLPYWSHFVGNMVPGANLLRTRILKCCDNSSALTLLEWLLSPDPSQRASAGQCLAHEYFDDPTGTQPWKSTKLPLLSIEEFQINKTMQTQKSGTFKRKQRRGHIVKRQQPSTKSDGTRIGRGATQTRPARAGFKHDPGRAEGVRQQTIYTRSASQHHLGDAAYMGAGDYAIFSSHRERRPSFSEMVDSRSPRQIPRGRGPSSREATSGRNIPYTARVGESAGSVEVRRPSLEGPSESRATFDTAAPHQRTPLSRESNCSRTSYVGHRHRRPSFTGDDKPPRKSPRDLRSLIGGSDDNRPPLRIVRERRASFRDRNFSSASAVEFAGSHLDASQSQPYANTAQRDQNRISSRDGGWRPAFATVLQRRPSSDETRNRRSPHVTSRERQYSLDDTRNRRSPHQTSRERQFSLDETRNRRSSHATSRERQFSLDETRNRRSPHVTSRERQYSFDETRNRTSPHVTPREQQVSLDETRRNRRSPRVCPRSTHVTSREQQFSLDDTNNRNSPRVPTLLVSRQDEKS